MPIKWTPERDQTLLLKILETSQITPNVKAISETWRKETTKSSPAATEVAPSPRAIQEHLHKLRAVAGGKGSGTFKMVATVGGRGNAKSRPAKSDPAKPSTPRKKGRASNKRKRASEDDDESDSSRVSFKAENNGSDVDDAKIVSAPSVKMLKQNTPTSIDVKEEPLEQGAMDSAFEASFAMPGEI
ncbi:MAG: hypothetical protein Q9178_005649 [Gyalolechia marmorata]